MCVRSVCGKRKQQLNHRSESQIMNYNVLNVVSEAARVNGFAGLIATLLISLGCTFYI